MRALVTKGARPLSVGRARRTFKGALARALEARDRTCRFPGCGAKAWLHNHHISYVHHRLVHRLRIDITWQDDEPVFRLPDGRVIEQGELYYVAELYFERRELELKRWHEAHSGGTGARAP